MIKKKKRVDEGMIMISSLLPIGPRPTLSMRGNKKDNFTFKGLPGQFNEQGEKVLDDEGNPIETEKCEIKETANEYKRYRKMLADIEDMLNELVNIGADNEIFQNAKHDAAALKQAYKLVNSVK